MALLRAPWCSPSSTTRCWTLRAVLGRLTDEESELYDALRSDAYAPGIRLEQELIRWDWALAQLSLAKPGD
ncbi:Wadjet anti-phage system protein JetD domain-containing protein [Arthrobacter sp. AB6]|uniref:Wadjet anti-phage system protein JetD domain-containing protein n=1 Tax=Arthrobacter sp. AB6 TaxID=2962570 RepID=UPI0037BF312A